MSRKLSRRTFVTAAGAAIAGAGLAGNFIKRQAAQPNLIFFIADDMRYDMAGYTGNRIVKTPNIDRLASEGIVFHNHFVTTSICCTSRASIMTGEYALRHRIYDFDTPLSPEHFNNAFFLHLRRAGYYTGYIGKWGIGGPMPSEHFDIWKGFPGQGDYHPGGNQEHLTDIQTDQALQFIQNTPANKPFLLIVAYKAPHIPLIPQNRFIEIYKDTHFEPAKTDTPEAAQKVPAILQLSRNRSEEYQWLTINYQVTMRNYYSLVSGLDDSIGRILSATAKRGLLDDTHVVFTSDNGLLNGEHRLGGKYCMYEESIRVPLVIRPAKKWNYRPSSTTAFSFNIDFCPTFLDFVNLPIPGHLQGKSLVKLIEHPNAAGREGFYYEHPRISGANIAGCEGYRDSQWKYARYTNEHSSEEFMVHLPSDPLELNNLAADAQHKPMLESLKVKMNDAKNAILKA